MSASTLCPLAVTEGGLVALIVTLVIGGLIGWVASIVMKTNAQQGLILNIVIGIVGSVIGHYVAGALGIVEGSQIARILVAIGGAVLLIIALRMLGILK